MDPQASATIPPTNVTTTTPISRTNLIHWSRSVPALAAGEVVGGGKEGDAVTALVEPAALPGGRANCRSPDGLAEPAGPWIARLDRLTQVCVGPLKCNVWFGATRYDAAAGD